MNYRIPPFHWWRTVFFLIPAITRVHDRSRHALDRVEPVQSSGRFAHWCARTWSRLILVTTGVDVEVSGLERLEPDRPYVFVANHQSIYDIPIIFWSLPYQIRIIAKESLGRFPFLGWHLRRTGHMLVDRRRPDRAAIFGRASKLMKQGLSLIVFPEGTRSRDGRVAPFKGGSFYLALEARPAGRADFDRRQPARDAEGTARDLSGPRQADRARADRHDGSRRRRSARGESVCGASARRDRA